MFKAKWALAFLLIFSFALAAQANDIIRVKVPPVGETFIIKLKSSSIYTVNPFETIIMPEAEIIGGGSCIDSFKRRSPDRVAFNTQFETISSGCAIMLRVTERDLSRGGTDVISFIRARKFIKIDVTNKWRKVKLGRGSYAILGTSWAAAEIDLDKSSEGCRKAHNGGNSDHGSGIASIITSGDVAVLEGNASWYRILPEPCTMRLRAYDGKTGTITLMKLSNKAILPPD